MEKISIIIPVYNSEKTVSRAIESILGQTYAEIELILVDDGSTDCSGMICDRYAAENANIKVVHVMNGGVSKARNIGLSYAIGKYVGFVDSDDWVEPEMYSVLVGLMEANEAQMVTCEMSNEILGCDIGDLRNQKVGIVDNGAVEIIRGMEMYSSVYYRHEIGGYLCNKLFRKQFIVEKLNEEISQCEDFLFVLGYLKHIELFVHIPQKFYHYQRNNEEENYQYSERTLSLLPAYEKILKIYEEKAKKYAADIRKHVLKNYLNFRARYKTIRDNDIGLKQQIDSGIKKYMKIVLKDKHVSIKEKINIVLTYIVPVTMLKAKKKILYRQRNQGKW